MTVPDKPAYCELPADHVVAGDWWPVLLALLDRRGIGRNPTDAQLVDTAGWMHDVVNALADCGYGLWRSRDKS